MDRRSFLGAAAVFGTPALTGCSAWGRTRRPGSTPPPTTPRSGLPVPRSELHRSARRDEIPAITDPTFDADWSGVELTTRTFAYEFPDRTYEYTIRPRLQADDVVVGVHRDGVARAYPLRILNWHEVVNDVFEPHSTTRRTGAGEPVLVTYCPLCASGVVAERTVADQATSFGVSGLLWRANLVLYDRLTGSLWSQLRAVAIRGPATGTELSLLPSRTTTWGEWRGAYPDTEVLLPPPLSNTLAGRGATRDYNQNPYFGYESSRRVGVGYERFEDDRIHPKTIVLGVSHRGVTRAYPLPTVLDTGVVNDIVGDLPVVVAADPADRLAAYDRRMDGRVLWFSRAGPSLLDAGGAVWNTTTGRAVTGPHAGRRLRPVTARSPMFWFAWADLHPETEVFGGDG
jgi:hypothetical protein